MTPYELHHGDCLEVMRDMPDDSVDAVVTDPPYGLAICGSAWDKEVPGVAYWAEALRVAKPGAHLLAFGGTRTVHRLVCAIEDAGWDVRDMIMWLYGSGFPKGNYPDVPGYESCSTVLKPACEPISLCRKPMIGKLATNLDAYGTGALNIGACRIGDSKPKLADNKKALARTDGGALITRTP